MLFHLKQVLHLKMQLMNNKKPFGFLFCLKKWYNKDGDDMLNVAKKILSEIEEHGYVAYIVGGYVRDYLLGNTSNDIDICTNATPKELKEIFLDALVPPDDYGSIIVTFNNIQFSITTFRREHSYLDHRHPDEVQYVDNLYQDLLRRDFTINSICMDKDENIIDLLHGKDDMNKKFIRTIGNSDQKFSQDALRILRAIRFATTLDFCLTDDVNKAITKHKKLLSSLSYERKREELDKIFTSTNAKRGISLLIELNLLEELEIPKLREVHYTDSLMAIWALLDVVSIYPFTSNEKDLMKDIHEAYLLNNLDPYVLYRYGLYVNSVVGEMKGESSSEITRIYNLLPIHSRRDIDATGDEICACLSKVPGSYLKEIYEDLEHAILYGKLENKKEDILSYCISSYHEL